MTCAGVPKHWVASSLQQQYMQAPARASVFEDACPEADCPLLGMQGSVFRLRILYRSVGSAACPIAYQCFKGAAQSDCSVRDAFMRCSLHGDRCWGIISLMTAHLPANR